MQIHRRGWARACVAAACTVALHAGAQDAKGTLTANGKSGKLAHALAWEVDSATEKGYLDVVVVLSDRKLPIEIARSFTTFIRSALWIRWQPSAYNEKRVAGRFHTDGERNEFRQTWSYDVTFQAPISLDPAAKTKK